MEAVYVLRYELSDVRGMHERCEGCVCWVGARRENTRIAYERARPGGVQRTCIGQLMSTDQ